MLLVTVIKKNRLNCDYVHFDLGVKEVKFVSEAKCYSDVLSNLWEAETGNP